MAKDQHLKPSSWFPVLFHDIPTALGKTKSSMWKTHVFPQDRLEIVVFPYAVGQIPLFPWLTSNLLENPPINFTILYDFPIKASI